MTRELRKPPELEVALDVLELVVKADDELEELRDEELATEEDDAEEELDV